MTHETYVSLETAKLLKQAGFDWEVRAFYRDNEFSKCGDIYDGTISFHYPAPTQAVAQRWLWNEKHILAEPQLDSYMTNRKREYFGCRIWHSDIFPPFLLSENGGQKFFPTYEAALEAGLQQCLTLITKEQ